MSRARTLALAVVAAASLMGGLAIAQQPVPGGGVMQPRQIPGLPPGHPAPGGRPPPSFPGGRQPPPGFPGFPGGRQPPGFPQQPGRQMLGPDGRPIQRPGFPQPQKPVPHHAAEPEGEGGHEHECPGHGPTDPPPPPNFWHGLLTVNNEAAEKGGFVNQLLFRYENPKDPCDPKNEPAPYLASLINFGVLSWILYRFGKKPMAEALLKRKQAIMGEIDAAAKLKAAAERRLEEYQDNIDNIDAKIAEARAEYAAQAELEKKQILKDAEERRVRMRRDAELRVEHELVAAREQLLRDAVEGAVAAAEALLVKQVDAADLDRMAGDYLKAVGPAISGHGGYPHTPGQGGLS